jgi:rhodanese-related sulfurtransferase
MFAVILSIVTSRLFPDGFQSQNEPFERIPLKRVAQLFTDGIPPEFPVTSFLVVDARSKAEYAGGHIRNAINSQHHFENVEHLYSERYNPDTLFIFHCEFSRIRGPYSAFYFQNIHRQSNSSAPLSVFVMDGGYSQFYPAYPELCDGEYWPEEWLDPSNPNNWEFLAKARQAHPEVF